MRKSLHLLLVLFAFPAMAMENTCPVSQKFHLLAAEKSIGNPLMGNWQNQAALRLGWGSAASEMVPNFGRMVPFGVVLLDYSQPAAIFRLPARMNFHLGYTVGWGEKYGENWRDYSWPQTGISLDASLISWGRFYGGTGVGAFMKWQVDARQDSRFMFMTRAFIGYRATDRFSGEAFIKHYSDGNLTPINGAYNFVGLGITAGF